MTVPVLFALAALMVSPAAAQDVPTQHAVCGPGLVPCPDRPDAPTRRLGPRLAFYGALAVADLASTEMFLHRRRDEGNPLMRDRAVRVISRTVATVGIAKLDQYLERKGKRRAAWAVRGVLALGTGIIVARNMRAHGSIE